MKTLRHYAWVTGDRATPRTGEPWSQPGARRAARHTEGRTRLVLRQEDPQRSHRLRQVPALLSLSLPPRRSSLHPRNILGLCSVLRQAVLTLESAQSHQGPTAIGQLRLLHYSPSGAPGRARRGRLVWFRAQERTQRGRRAARAPSTSASGGPAQGRRPCPQQSMPTCNAAQLAQRPR